MCNAGIPASGQKATYIITGGSSGLGKETVRQLAAIEGIDANIVLACRDMALAQDAIRDIANSIPQTNSVQLSAMQLDLANFTSIRRFCNDVEQHLTRIDCLICNAGVMVPDSCGAVTANNIEINVGINYLGHVLLIDLLRNKLQRSAPSRIVMVSSILLTNARLNLDLLGEVRPRRDGSAEDHGDHSGQLCYAESKLMMALYCKFLCERLPGVSVYCLSPGWCRTRLHRHSSLAWYKVPAVALMAALFMQSVRKGSETVVLCATQHFSRLQNGRFYRKGRVCQQMEQFLSSFSQQQLRQLYELSVRAVHKAY